MSTPVRLLAFAVLLVVVGLAGFGVGNLTGPVGSTEGPRPAAEHSTGEEHS